MMFAFTNVAINYAHLSGLAHLCSYQSMADWSLQTTTHQQFCCWYRMHTVAVCGAGSLHCWVHTSWPDCHQLYLHPITSGCETGASFELSQVAQQGLQCMCETAL